MDFTLSKYRALIHAVISSELPVYSIEAWIRHPGTRGVIIRHDVDRCPRNALKMAKLEHEHNIHTTYYFRIKKDVFRPSLIRQIAGMGHEIGYHYEDLSAAGGNFQRAIRSFEKNLERFREVCPVRTIAMHGKPLSGWNNLDLWNRHDPDEFDLSGDAFLSIDYSSIHYFTDTGRTWQEKKNNLRDFTQSRPNPEGINATDDLIEFIRDHPHEKIALVAHPERWNDSFIRWFLYVIFDSAVNVIKTFIRIFRR
mgnify:FL=1